MDYLYFLTNASVTLRTIEYLRNMEHTANASLTVIHQIDGWIVKIHFPQALEPRLHGNLCSFMSELGVVYEPEMRLKMVFWSLETGQSPVEVMRRYQVAVVQPNRRTLHSRKNSQAPDSNFQAAVRLQ